MVLKPHRLCPFGDNAVPKSGEGGTSTVSTLAATATEIAKCHSNILSSFLVTESFHSREQCAQLEDYISQPALQLGSKGM
jgi:hypothetical protein